MSLTQITSSDQLREITSGGAPVVLLATTSECSLCAPFKTLVEAEAQAFKGTSFCLLICDESSDTEELADDLSVEGVPTLLIIQGDEAQHQIEGAVPRKDLRAFLARHLPQS